MAAAAGLASSGALLPDWVLLLLLAAASAGCPACLHYGMGGKGRDLDALTGTLSRRMLEEDLGRFEQRGDPFGLLFIDVVGLKQINDGRGHAAGDAHLRQVALLIRRSVRPLDRLYRYGGDEFVVVLPGVGGERVQAVCDRVALGRSALMTVGAGAFPRDGASAHDVLRKADAAMYLERWWQRPGGQGALPMPVDALSGDQAAAILHRLRAGEGMVPPVLHAFLDEFARSVATACEVWAGEGVGAAAAEAGDGESGAPASVELMAVGSREAS
jgi:diguanylate cyclase (GGDEF)-like protein